MLKENAFNLNSEGPQFATRCCEKLSENLVPLFLVESFDVMTRICNGHLFLLRIEHDFVFVAHECYL